VPEPPVLAVVAPLRLTLEPVFARFLGTYGPVTLAEELRAAGT
jgi:hypothetical protein